MPGVETFVIRITEPAPGSHGATSTELHGVAEHLRSRESRSFRGSNQLLRLLADWLAAPQVTVGNTSTGQQRR